MTGLTLNRVQMAVSAGGLGDITLGAASAGFRSFAVAGAVDGGIYAYLITDGSSSWEFGYMTYHAATTSLSRTAIVGSSNSNAAINVSTSATVACVDLAKGDAYAGMSVGSLGLGTSYTNLTGCSITLGPGRWDIYAQMNGGMTGTGTAFIQIFNSTDNTPVSGANMSANGGFAWTMPTRALVTLTGPKTFVLRGKRDTGANINQNSDTGSPSTFIHAVQIG
jgi:hypothetical protein